MGMITDVRIWRRALTLEEIQQSMLSPPDTDDADLVGFEYYYMLSGCCNNLLTLASVGGP